MNASSMTKMALVVGAMAVLSGCSTTSIINEGAKNNGTSEVVVSNRDKIKTDGRVAINIEVNPSEKGSHVFDTAVIKQNLADYLAKRDIKLDDSSNNKYTLKLLSFTAVEPSQYKKTNSESVGSVYSTVSGQSVGSAAGIMLGEALLEKMFGDAKYFSTTTYEILDDNKNLKTKVSVTGNLVTVKQSVNNANTFFVPLSASEFFIK